MNNITLDIEEKLFQMIFNAIADAASLWQMTKDGKIILFMTNQAASKITKSKIEKYVGYSVEEFFTDNIEIAKDIIHVMNTGENKRIELEIKLRTTGEKKWFLSDYVKVNDNFVLNIAKDITDRKKIEKALSDSEERLRHLIENTDDMIFIQDFNGKYLYYNGPQKYGLTPTDIIGKTPNDFLSIDYSDRIIKRIKYVADTGESILTETEFEWNGEKNWFLDNIYPIKDINDKIISIATISRKITQLKLAEIALKESEERYRILVEQSPDAIGIIQDKIIVFVNKATLKLINAHSELEIVGHHFTEFLLPESFEDIRKYFAKVNSESSPQSIETKFKTIDGRLFFIEVITVKILYKERQAFQYIARDITKRISTEKKLRDLNKRLRSLTTHIHLIVEDERMKIAREIHDELGQALTGLKIDLSFLQETVNESFDRMKLDDKIKSMIDLIDLTIQTVRRISTELHPIILDKLGLTAAIEWLSEDVQKRTGIRCNFTLPAHEIILDKNISTALYRIFQESMTNVIRHSFASKVNISFVKEENQLIMKIRDNGIGIAQSEIDNNNSFGIFGMKERVRELKGAIKIKGQKGKGTLVTIVIPLKNNYLKKDKQNDQHTNRR